MDTIRTWRIYKITCVVTNKSYIGLTSDTVKQRWSNHVSSAMNKNTMSLFHKAIRKHGRLAFIVDTVCEVRTLEEASAAERSCIISHQTLVPNGYNLSEGGAGTPGVRRPHSEETKAKIGMAHKGKTASPESRKLMSERHRGVPLTAEHREKLSIAQKGRQFSDLHRANIAAGHRGKSFPARSVALLKSAATGGPHRGVTPEGKRWTARIGMNRKRVHLGVFDTIEEASAAYRIAVLKRIAELGGV